MTATRQFPCRQCGAKLEFAPGTDHLACPYCGAANEIAAAPADTAERDYQTYLGQLAGQADVVETALVKCRGCGAESALPAGVVASTCPFCAAPVVATASKRLIRPQALLPFKIPRNDAQQRFRDWIGSLWFAPSALQRQARTEGGIQGIYTPYWTYDCAADSQYRGQRGDDYYETESYVERDAAGNSVTRTREVKRTRWTPVGGRVHNQFDDVLVVASQSLPRKYAEALEPWDLENFTAPSDEYLAGFVAEAYQLGLEEGFKRAGERMDEPIRASVCRDIGGDHQRIDALETTYDQITFKHVLLPVWLAAYRFNGETFRFLVNARTGEVQGERPWSVWKILGAVMLVVLVIYLFYRFQH